MFCSDHGYGENSNETEFCRSSTPSQFTLGAGGWPVIYASGVAGVGGPTEDEQDCYCYSGITGQCYKRRCDKRRHVEVCRCVTKWACEGEKQDSNEWRALMDCREELNLAVTAPDETNKRSRTAVLDPNNHYQHWRQNSEGKLINRGSGKASANSWSFNDKECLRSSQEPKPREPVQKLMIGKWFRYQCLSTVNRNLTSGSLLRRHDCKTIHPVNGCFKFGNRTFT